MFHFEKEYNLKNKTVELTPLREEHESELFHISNSKEIWRFFTEKGFGRENFRSYIKNALQKREEKVEYPLVIKDLRANKLAGMTRLYDVSNELKNIKIGHTWVGEKFQGTDLNKACKYVLFEFLFDELKFERIGFGVSELNVRSLKAMESVGCKVEGKLRGFLPSEIEGKRIDIILLSLLKNEWEAGVKRELKGKIKAYE
ncbi:MAG: GNAT family protein [Bacteroidota bacterium]